MTKKSILFLIITFSLSWLMALVFKLSNIEWTTSSSLMLTLPFMFTPMISAIIVQKAIYKERFFINAKGIFKPNKWFVIAWLAPPLYAILTMFISLLSSNITFTPDMSGFINQFRGLLTQEQLELMESQITSLPFHPFWITIIQGMIAGLTINAVAGFGEELGWRELLFKDTVKLGFWKSSLLIGFIWGIWHAPVILFGHNYPEHPVLGVLMMTIWCILLSPLFSYIRYKSGSVIAASILHGTLNGTAGLAVMLISGGSDLTKGVTGVFGFVVLIVLNIILIPIMKKEPEFTESA